MKNKRTIVLASVAAVSLAVITAFIGQNQTKSWYKPSAKAELGSGQEAEESQSQKGAADWWFNRLKNPATGEIDPLEVIRIQELANQNMHSSSQRSGDPNMSTQSASWTELGPDNVGGRTRAILFDNQDPQHKHMWAGGVSGGLFESTDGAANWHRCPGYFSAAGAVSTVVTIAQAPNGTLYVGTGEGNFYFLAGTGTAGFTGNGIFQSTDDGVTWNSLAATQPATQNSNSAAWIGVNKIQVDPSNSNHVYAGTNRGFKISNDAGVTWVSAVGPGATGVTTDVQVSNNGHVIAVVSNKPWLSTDNGATFTNVSLSGSGWPSAGSGRVTISIAPSDPNFVYAFLALPSGVMQGVYVSEDGGTTWSMICGVGNAQFDPFGGNAQGTYDNIVSVDPNDKHRAIFGGTALYEWDMVTENPVGGQWTQIASEFPASPFNPFYVHSDKHIITWHPTLAGVFYVGCDGGIFKSGMTQFGLTFAAMNSGYNVTQCYSVAIENTEGLRNQSMAGCQDNGTNFIDGMGNTAMSSNAVDGGDGGWCDISFLNPLATFSTVYFGALHRSNNRGASISQFYNARIQALAGFGTGAFASFVTPERIWESTNDLLAADSISIINGLISMNTPNITNGTNATYTGTISYNLDNAVPVGTIVLSSVKFIAGPDTLVSDGAGNISGDGTGTVTGATGVYTITFNTTPANNIVIRTEFLEQYGAGTTFTVNSNVAGKTLQHTIGTTMMPYDTVKVQDVIQSHIAVGFTGNNGIWMTRRAIDFSATPMWIKIAGTPSVPSPYGGECSCMAWSPDGDNLYVGTSSGAVYRISNLGTVTDTLNGGVDYLGPTSSQVVVINPTCQVTCTLIGNFSGRDVSMIDVNPNNPDQVVVSLGNYSQTQYCYLTTIATTATTVAGTFVDRTGNLDNIGGCPAYTVTFDKYVANRILIGTEHGVYETTNIMPSQSAANPTWAAAMTGLDYCPVDMIRQQRWEAWQVPNSGCFYIGTHGRGMWRDDSSFQAPNGIYSPSNPYSSSENAANHDLKVFPNPVVDNSNVIFNLTKQGDVTVQIYDLTGKIVYTKDYENLNIGTNTVQFETQEMVKGTYIITVLQGSKRIGSGRFMKMN